MAKPKGPNGMPGLDALQEASGSREDLQERKMQFQGFGAPPEYKEEQTEEVRTAPPKRATHDDAALQRQYQSFQPGQDESDEEDEDDLDDEDMEEEWEDDEEEGEDYEYPTPISLRQPGGAYMRDEPLFEGGPLVSDINSWKKQFEVDGHTIHMSEDIGGQTFIWRSLARTEYREIMNLPNTDPLQREEIICEICVLFPYNYDFSSMAAQKAGTPAVLAEQILGESGFRKPTPPVRL